MVEILPRTGKGVREALVEDLPAISKLYNEIEPDEPLTLDHYRAWWVWLHVSNPQNRKLVLGAFGPDGACLGHLSAIALAFSIDGVETPAAFSCQLMVAESKRQSFLYPSLIAGLFKDYQGRGSAFIYSTVVRPRVLQGNLAVGFKRGPQLPVYLRPYRTAPLLRRALGERLEAVVKILGVFSPIPDALLKFGWGAPRDVRVTEAKRFPMDVDDLWARLAGALKLAAVRRASILDWRFFGESGRDYSVYVATRAGRTVGYVALREMPMRGVSTLAVVDILYDPNDPDTADALLAQVHAEAKLRKVDAVTIVLNPASEFLQPLKRWGFLRSPEAFTIITHEPKGSDRVTNRPPEDWHLTWFDHDYV